MTIASAFSDLSVQLSSVLSASIPSPSQGVWWIGPIPLRAYGIIIATGMVIAAVWSAKRYRARGGDPDVIYDFALWIIIAGLLGARLYHVATHIGDYFYEGAQVWKAFAIWEGGMAIWGGVLGGALAAWLLARIKGVRLGPIADSIAPTLLVAQAMGRWGNYFNQELFGGPTTLPWGLEIDAAHLPAGYAEGTLFHPTFLYESLWNLMWVGIILLIERKFRLFSGQTFGLYLIAYPLGRFWIEAMRTDIAYEFLGIRVNGWAALAGLLIGIATLIIARRVAAPRDLQSGEAGTLDTDFDTDGENGADIDLDVAEGETETIDLDPARRGSSDTKPEVAH